MNFIIRKSKRKALETCHQENKWGKEWRRRKRSGSLNGSKAPYFLSYFSDDGSSSSCLQTALSLFTLLPLLWLLFLVGRRGRRKRERTPPFPIAALTLGGRKACKPLNCAPFHLRWRLRVVLCGLKGKRPVPKTEHSQDPETVDTEFPLVALCVPLSSLFCIKKLRVKITCCVEFNIIPSFIWGTFLCLPTFPSLFLIYILLWHFMHYCELS